jgi:GT2 family glycosyltransferase
MIPNATPLVSIIIPNYNGAPYLEVCLQSLLRQSYENLEIVIVDNGSHDNSVSVVRRLASQALLLSQGKNLGFAAAVNVGIRAAHGDWIAVLNNDTEAAPRWLSECVHAIHRHPEATFLACRILDFEERDVLYGAGDCFLRAGVGYRRGQEQKDKTEYHREVEIFSACGCAAFYRKSAIEAAGGYDERFFAYFEDVDLGLRLQAAGLKGYFVPDAVIYHRGGATSGGEFSPIAVRLRTRNSLLMLIKSMPGSILWRCLPMIAIAQLSWLGRAVAHGRFLSYLRGCAGVFPLIPAMIRDRTQLNKRLKAPITDLWQRILMSEAMARRDFLEPVPEGASLFLRWYFRLF